MRSGHKPHIWVLNRTLSSLSFKRTQKRDIKVICCCYSLDLWGWEEEQWVSWVGGVLASESRELDRGPQYFSVTSQPIHPSAIFCPSQPERPKGLMPALPLLLQTSFCFLLSNTPHIHNASPATIFIHQHFANVQEVLHVIGGRRGDVNRRVEWLQRCVLD